jgi:hypothetical protein
MDVNLGSTIFTKKGAGGLVLKPRVRVLGHKKQQSENIASNATTRRIPKSEFKLDMMKIGVSDPSKEILSDRVMN